MESLSIRTPARLLIAILFAASAVASAAGAARGASVRKITLNPVAGGTQLDVVLDGPVEAPRLFTLSGPDRVVLDLPATAHDARRTPLPGASGLVRKLRSGPREDGTRFVLEVDPQTVARRVDAPAGHVVLALTPAPRTGVVAASAPVEPVAASVSVPAESTSVPVERAVDRAATAEPSPAVKPVARSVSPGAVSKGRVLVIAVDAGHGGEDPGASGPDGTHEKDVTLSIARELAARINAEPSMRAVLTRPDDHFVPLRERIHRARRAQADLFVSVHADAVPDHSVSGASVYVLSARGATNEAAKWLADRENAADLVGGVSLDDKDNVLASVLLDLSQSAAMSASMVAAEKVLNELNTVGEVRKARVQQAGFVVLKSPDIPSMLIETAYITNPGEEKRLRDERYQQRLATAILAGIRSYFRDSPLPGTRLASLSSEQSATTSTR
jgi:N-acetylmuramoyl-L-alanine amidase